MRAPTKKKAKAPKPKTTKTATSSEAKNSASLQKKLFKWNTQFFLSKCPLSGPHIAYDKKIVKILTVWTTQYNECGDNFFLFYLPTNMV